MTAALRHFATTVLAALVFFESTVFASASTLPRLEADSLGGKHVVLPDDAGGKPIVLVLGFARESENALNTWAHKLLTAVGARAQIYVVIVADSGPFFTKRKVKKKIAGSALATQAQLENNILVTFRGEGWRDIAPPGPGKDAGIVVADASGQIVFAKREPYSDAALADAAKAVP
ncbi:MAG TPA: hypothetical protein VMA36_04025 [Candidatus Limnocylindria bacterium]|jgi:hypothetical protein|nr:hypothetical protein [Candidatus Limnocylindria bacterium]